MRDPRKSVISGNGGSRTFEKKGIAAAGRLNMSSEIIGSMFSAKFAFPPHVRVKRFQSTTLSAGSGSPGWFGLVFRTKSRNRRTPTQQLMSYWGCTMLWPKRKAAWVTQSEAPEYFRRKTV